MCVCVCIRCGALSYLLLYSASQDPVSTHAVLSYLQEQVSLAVPLQMVSFQREVEVCFVPAALLLAFVLVFVLILYYLACTTLNQLACE